MKSAGFQDDKVDGVVSKKQIPTRVLASLRTARNDKVVRAVECLKIKINGRGGGQECPPHTSRSRFLIAIGVSQ